MKLEMTERDKKLLVMLSIFVIVVCIGYWGVYPHIKSVREANKEIEEEQEIKDENELKILLVPILEKDNETIESEIQSAREMYFSMMSSAEIDKYFTNLALSYNLYSYDLSISLSDTETSLSPYQYSQRAADLEAAAATEATTEASDSDSEEEELDDATEATSDSDEVLLDDGPVTTGIYDAQVTMRLGGDENDLNRLIEDFSNTDQKIRICSYSWAEQSSVGNITEDGDYDIITERILTITFELYMYQEDPDETADSTESTASESE